MFWLVALLTLTLAKTDDWMAVTDRELAKPELNAVRVMRHSVVGRYHVYELRGTRAAAEFHAWSRASEERPPLAFARDHPIRMHACRTAPPTAGRGYVQGYFSYGLDRVDQRTRLTDLAFCTGGYTGTGVHAWILDTGIAPHSTLADRLHQDYDYFGSGPPPSDPNGHGTHVAGLIGSSVYGVATGVQLHSVRVLDANGDGTFSSLAAGLLYVLEHKAAGAKHVINLSLGAHNGASDPVETLLALAVDAAHDVLVVASAGNDNGLGCDSFPGRLSTVHTVGATTPYDLRASFSNYGSCVDIWAPGESIISAHGTGSGALILSGTSMSAPIVAGAAVLIRQQYPTWTQGQVRTELTARSTRNALGNLQLHEQASPNLLLYVPPTELTSSPPPIAPIDSSGRVREPAFCLGACLFLLLHLSPSLGLATCGVLLALARF